MTPANAREFFNLLTPLIPDAKCGALKFLTAKLEIFSLASSFFQGKSIHEIIVYYLESKQEDRYFLTHVHITQNNLFQWLYTEACWTTPSKCHYLVFHNFAFQVRYGAYFEIRIFYITAISDAFLVKLAAIVDSIIVASSNNSYARAERQMNVSLMKDLAFQILKCRCNTFDVSYGFAQISAAETRDISAVSSFIISFFINIIAFKTWIRIKNSE